MTTSDLRENLSDVCAKVKDLNQNSVSDTIACLDSLLHSSNSDEKQIFTIKKKLICRLDNRCQSVSERDRLKKLSVDLQDFGVLNKLLKKLSQYLRAKRLNCINFGEPWSDTKVNKSRTSAAVALSVKASFLELDPQLPDLFKTIVSVLKEIEDHASMARNTVQLDNDSGKLAEKALEDAFSMLKKSVCRGVQAAEDVYNTLLSRLESEFKGDEWLDTFKAALTPTRCRFRGRPSRTSLFNCSDSCKCGLVLEKLSFSNSTIICVDFPLPFQHTCGIGIKEELQRKGWEREDFLLSTMVNLFNLQDRDIQDKIIFDGGEFSDDITLNDIRNARKRVNSARGLTGDDVPDVIQRVNASVEAKENIFRAMKIKSSPDSFEINPEWKLKDDHVFMVLATDDMLSDLARFGKIVCADATHSTTSYDGLKLITVMVVNEEQKGMPAAWCIASEETDVVYAALFDKLRLEVGKLGLCWTPQALMSDLAPATWNGLNKAFGAEVAWYYCSWHTLRAWKKQLKEKMQNLSTVDRNIYATLFLNDLHKIMYTLNQKRAQQLLNELKRRLAQTRFLEVAEYLQSVYFAHYERWIFAYREVQTVNGIVLRTNMFVESWHSVLKRIHFNGRRNHKLLTLITILQQEIVRLERKKKLSRKKLQRQSHFEQPMIAGKRAEQSVQLPVCVPSGGEPEAEKAISSKDESGLEAEHLHHQACKLASSVAESLALARIEGKDIHTLSKLIEYLELLSKEVSSLSVKNLLEMDPVLRSQGANRTQALLGISKHENRIARKTKALEKFTENLVKNGKVSTVRIFSPELHAVLEEKVNERDGRCGTSLRTLSSNLSQSQISVGVVNVIPTPEKQPPLNVSVLNEIGENHSIRGDVSQRNVVRPKRPVQVVVESLEEKKRKYIHLEHQSDESRVPSDQYQFVWNRIQAVPADSHIATIRRQIVLRKDLDCLFSTNAPYPFTPVAMNLGMWSQGQGLQSGVYGLPAFSTSSKLEFNMEGRKIKKRISKGEVFERLAFSMCLDEVNWVAVLLLPRELHGPNIVIYCICGGDVAKVESHAVHSALSIFENVKWRPVVHNLKVGNMSCGDGESGVLAIATCSEFLKGGLNPHLNLDGLRPEKIRRDLLLYLNQYAMAS